MTNSNSGALAAESSRRLRLVIAFAAVYIVWGSTYLAIRYATETLPPLLMAGVRFLIAGGILYAWARLISGIAKPEPRFWISTGIVGVFLLMGGNGLVMWAEGVRKVPSGITALMLGFTPVWMTLLGWLWIRTRRPGPRSIIGLCAGFAGLMLLVGPHKNADPTGPTAIDRLGAVALICAGLSWSIGSLYSKRARMPQSPLLATAMEMLAGGVALLLAGSLRGEWASTHPSQFSLLSALSLLYLIVFGSLVGFSAYIYCLQHTAPALASTYAYVNPVVAVALGWEFAHEALATRTFIAAAVIIFGVIMISLEEGSSPPYDKVAENPEVCEPAA